MAAPVQREAVEHGRRHPTVRQARRTSAITVLTMLGKATDRRCSAGAPIRATARVSPDFDRPVHLGAWHAAIG